MRSSDIRPYVTSKTKQLDKYLNEIAKHKLLTPKEEVELAIKIRYEDEVALEKLINANLRFVVSIALQYDTDELSLNNLINEGHLALIHAALSFDETEGFTFITYASWAIRGAILQAIDGRPQLAGQPSGTVNVHEQINSACQKLEQQYSYAPNAEELMQASGRSKDEVHLYFRSNMHAVSAECPHNTVRDQSLAEAKEPCTNNGLWESALTYSISALIKALPHRDSEIISSYLGLYGQTPMSLDELGKQYGVTHESIRQIKEKCMRLLKLQIYPSVMCINN